MGADVCVWVCAHECSAWRDQKGALDPLELELQAVLNRLTWFQELNLGPLEEESILVAAEPSF